jgi:type I restriction enzyme S subunit
MPEGWQKVKFGDAVRNVREIERDPLSAGLERYVGLEHIESDNLHIREWGLVADGTSFTRRFVKGQVLFGKRRAYQRKVAVAEFDGVCSGDILVFEPKDNRLLPELLPFIVQSERFFANALRTSSGSLSPRTRWRDLAAYEFPLPPLDEQRRIAAILWAAEVEKRALLTVTVRLDQLFSSIGVEIFLDKSIERVTLGDLASDGLLEFQTGPFGTVLKASSYVDQGTPVINPINMVDGKIVTSEGPFLDEDECERLAHYRVITGDIVLGRKGDVGRSVYVTEAYDGYIIGSDIIRIRLSSGSLGSAYLYCFLRSLPAKSWLARHATGTTMPGINERILSRLEVPVPSVSHQRRIVQMYSEIDRVAGTIRAKIESHNSLMRQLIDDLLA